MIILKINMQVIRHTLFCRTGSNLAERFPSGGRDPEAGRPGEGLGVTVLSGVRAPRNREAEEGGVHRIREIADQQETGADFAHRRPS